MQPLSYAEKHYQSANKRLFESVLDRFLQENVPQLGPELRSVFGKQLIDLFEKNIFMKDRIKPGQMLWIAVDKNTRADSQKVRYIPIILTLVNKEEINDLVKGESNGFPSRLLPNTIARICNEAFRQGALLSMRDIALIFKRASAYVSTVRMQYEKEHSVIVPTPSTLQDMGSGITHKTMILRKVLIEKKDMAKVRSETHHSQQAIDKYLKEYRRIEILLDDEKPINYISKVTNIRPFVIKQYEKIYKQVKKS